MDLALAIVLFLIAFISFFFLFSGQTQKDMRSLVEENVFLVSSLQSSSSMRMIDRGQFTDAAELERMLRMDDAEMKATLGLAHDFCVIFHDSEGKLKPIELSSGCYAVSFGTRTVNFLINGRPVPCGTSFSADGCPCGQVLQEGACRPA